MFCLEVHILSMSICCHLQYSTNMLIEGKDVNEMYLED